MLFELPKEPNKLFYTHRCLIILAGLPTTTQLSGISLTITLPAPIVTLLPTRTGPIIVTLAPNVTLSPIIGRPLLVFPNVVQCMQ